jgi:hypothetical protein
MKYRTLISILFALMLALVTSSIYADQGKGGGGPAERDHPHTQDPMSMSDREIYGSELMTKEERNQYRKQLADKETERAREQYRNQHEEQMQERARNQGKDLVPPGQGSIYGGELMTVEERNRYREQLRRMETEEERLQFQAQHREKMNARAKALELEVEETG